MQLDGDGGSLWSKLKEALRGELSAQVFATWIEPLRVHADDGKVLRLMAPNSFALDWVNTHYRGFIEEVLSRIGSAALEIRLASAPGSEGQLAPARPTPAPEAIDTKETREPPAVALNARYTFSAFVVGPSNELAHTAARHVAEQKMSSYNPLVIVGESGLGKTHLLHAVGHEALKRKPPIKICTRTSEEFINDVISGIRGNNMEPVRRKYRACDLLLIDDIQLIAGKDACQEEFFHTFNALYDAHKQIVVTSDRMPHEIPLIEERIRSRFRWGLIADLRVPELETRLLILKRRADAEGFAIDDDVAMYLAQQIRSNVRELEGCLIRARVYASVRKQHLSVALVREALVGIVSERAQAPTCEQIIRVTASHFDLKPADLKSQSRARRVAFPRQIAMYLCRVHTGASYPEIGQAFGGKDHTTALAAHKRTVERRNDPEVRGHIDDIERSLLDQSSRKTLDVGDAV